MFLCLVTGRFVPPIQRQSLYSLQYSMLPAKRVTVVELWHMLHGNLNPARERSKGPVNGNLNANGNTNDKGKRAISQGRKVKEGMWWSK